MSSVINPIEAASTADLPPGAAPEFGYLESGAAQDPAVLVLLSRPIAVWPQRVRSRA